MSALFSRLAKAAASARRARRRRRVLGRLCGVQGKLKTGSQKSPEPQRSKGQRPLRERRHYSHAPNLRGRRSFYPARLLSVQSLKCSRHLAEFCYARKIGGKFRRRKRTLSNFISIKFEDSFCFFDDRAFAKNA